VAEDLDREGGRRKIRATSIQYVQGVGSGGYLLEDLMDLEEKDYEGFVRRIDQIDKILQPPVEGLLDLAFAALDRRAADGKAAARSLDIPSTVAEDRRGQPTPLGTALCCVTLQRIWMQRRRFPLLCNKLKRLRKYLDESLPKDDPGVVELLAGPFLRRTPKPASLRKLAEIVANVESGPADPYTASQVFWALLHSGEKNTHTATGFFSFFVIVWALRKGLPAAGGVALGESEPTAYVTAKCAAPLFNLQSICRSRAGLLDAIAELLHELRDLLQHPAQSRRGQLPLRLDELSGKLHELSRIAMSREGFRDCADEIGKIADRLHVRSDTDGAWGEVVESLARAMSKVGTVAAEGLSEARGLVKEFLPSLLRALQGEPGERSKDDRVKKLKRLGFPLSPPLFHEAAARERYWKDLADSAGQALDACESALEALEEARRLCSKLTQVSHGESPLAPATIEKLLDRLIGKRSKEKEKQPRTAPTPIFAGLALANRRVADRIEVCLKEAVQWCDDLLTRQIAYASADNLTEFDPAELVSALFVTVSGGRIGSKLLITEAVEKALVGVRSDGSWVAGQPFYIHNGDLGICAPTSDIVWMLSSTIMRYPEVRVADDALGAYVDWLERTRKPVNYPTAQNGSEHGQLSGWISERNLKAKRVDVWATTFAINALLGIRELMEFRLWELCERRFTIVESERRLSDIEPVDLGAVHAHRLHRQLASIARRAAGDAYEEAEYSLILHGPPGTAKTAITQALATEMWRSAPPRIGPRGARLIRITPADFTRKGEDRLDSEARIIFDILRRIRRVTVLFDEIDDLLRKRDDTSEVSFFKLVVPAMLNRLQDLRDACPRQEICFVLATNYVDRIEPALLRKGRIDKALPLVYPDRESRRGTLGKNLAPLRKRIETDGFAPWAASLLEQELDGDGIEKTDYWSWKTFDVLCTETITGLERLWRESAAEPARDKRARQHIQDAVARGKAERAAIAYDDKRRAGLAASAALREELLHYSLAGAEGVAALLARLSALMQHGDPASLASCRCPLEEDGRVPIEKKLADSLRQVLGEDLAVKLRRIAEVRSWPDVKLELRERRRRAQPPAPSSLAHSRSKRV
jgi:ATPase family associated with various cellular activities (AAA)